MRKEAGPVRIEDLIAHADGRLDPQRATVIDEHLAGNPQDAETVRLWREQNEAIHELYDHAAREKVPSSLDPHRIARHRPTGSWRMAAAAAVLLAIGVAGGWFGRAILAPQAEASRLVVEALAAHRLYSGEVVHPVEVAATQEAHLAKWLSKRLDRPLDIPDLSAAGFHLVGGRLLPAGDNPAAQFMYEDESGRRITLYIVPTTLPGESALRFAGSDRLSTFTWRDARLTCAVVGDLPRDALHQLAVDAYKQLG